jgi:hypothetical protein
VRALLALLLIAPLLDTSAQAPQVVLYALSAETLNPAALQGTMFAHGNRWTCTGRQCRSSLVGRHSAPELQRMCAALAAEAGPVRAFSAGDRRLTVGELEECRAPEKPATPFGPAQISSRFSLVREPGGFWLGRSDGARLAVARDWLLTQEESAQERDGYVSTLEFDAKVQEFALGDGRVGLHLSSYAIAVEGSAQAAAGRDVFLVYDARASTLSDGGLRLGVSKSRDRAAGYWTAKRHRFYLQDVDADGRLDIGVLREEIRCNGAEEPIFHAVGMRWHTYSGGRWVANPAHDAVAPGSSVARELRPIGLAQSPVEFVRARCDAGRPAAR